MQVNEEGVEDPLKVEKLHVGSDESTADVGANSEGRACPNDSWGVHFVSTASVVQTCTSFGVRRGAAAEVRRMRP